MGSMDCLRCLDGDAKLAELTYRNDDLQKMFLCDGCVRYFGDESGVREIALPRTPGA